MREQWQAIAEDAIIEYQQAGTIYADLAGHEMDLEALRPIEKDAAIRRIMETENPLTSKPHSASSAEKIVEADEAYRAALAGQREVVVQKHRAFTRMQAAKLRAEMAIALLRSHEAGVVA